MPTTTNGLPYPASTAAPNVPADIQALALALDPIAKTPKVAAGIVSMTFAAEVFRTAAVTFPVGRFTTAPAVNVTGSGTNAFVGYLLSSATTTGVTIGLVTRGGTAATTTVGAQWIAVQQAIHQT